MSATVKIRCPNLVCRMILTVSTSMRGKRVRCASCGETLMVPKSAAGPAPARPPAGAVVGGSQPGKTTPE